jgi:hypothetical protein
MWFSSLADYLVTLRATKTIEKILSNMLIRRAANICNSMSSVEFENPR